MGTLSHDLRCAFRQLWKGRGNTIVIVCTLGLLTGTLSLALGAIQHQRSARLPFPRADRLVRLWRIGPERPQSRFPVAVYGELRQQVRSLESIAAVGSQQSYVLTGLGEPKSLSGQQVSSSVFSVSGIAPVLGRTFKLEEERSDDAQAMVLSHGAWQRYFGGDESALGRTVNLGGIARTLIGVMPEGFDTNALFYGVDIWLPGNFESPSRKPTWVEIVGRVGPDSSASQLEAELDVLVPPILEAESTSRNLADSCGTVSAFPIDKQFGRVETAAVVFIAVIPLFVLLIACFNIANILLARVTARHREFAVRSSLGAGRYRLIRQVLTESVLLAAGGGLAGLVGATWISGWAASQGLPMQLSPAVLGAVAGVTLAIGLAVGWLPAWWATRRDLVSDLKEGGGSASGGLERHRLRACLVGGQVAMATVLCISAGLLVRTYLNKKRFDPGFETGHLVSVSVSLRQPAYKLPERRLSYSEQVVERIRDIAGVEEVGVCSTATIDRHVFPMGFRLPEDDDQWKRGRWIHLSVVSPNYLKMLNVPILQGQPLAERDRRGSSPVALVNQSFVEQFLAKADPVGRQFSLSIESRQQWFTIVGVVPDRRNLGFQEDLGAEAYLCHQQVAPEWAQYFFLARTTTSPRPIGRAIRQAVQSVDGDQPVSSPVTADARLQRARARRGNVRGTQAIAAMGLFGLLMAVMGIYGVVSNAAIERTRELGVRKALGAGQGDITRFVVKQGMRPTLVGLGVGVLLALGTTFGISQLLFGVSPLDPTIYLLVSLLLGGTALLASLLPALRAGKVDPMEALRYE